MLEQVFILWAQTVGDRSQTDRRMVGAQSATDGQQSGRRLLVTSRRPIGNRSPISRRLVADLWEIACNQVARRLPGQQQQPKTGRRPVASGRRSPVLRSHWGCDQSPTCEIEMVARSSPTGRKPSVTGVYCIQSYLCVKVKLGLAIDWVIQIKIIA